MITNLKMFDRGNTDEMWKYMWRCASGGRNNRAMALLHVNWFRLLAEEFETDDDERFVWRLEEEIETLKEAIREIKADKKNES